MTRARKARAPRTVSVAIDPAAAMVSTGSICSRNYSRTKGKLLSVTGVMNAHIGSIEKTRLSAQRHG